MKPTAGVAGQRELLLRVLDEAYNKKAWHGPNLRGSIRRVSAQEATWRPRRRRHNIAEIVLHCAYWKYAVRRRIRGDKRGSFPLKGSNWFAASARLTEDQWREYVALLGDQHRTLRETIAESPWSRLAATTSSGQKGLADYVYGIALHDNYHTGQIQTLKALYKTRNES